MDKSPEVIFLRCCMGMGLVLILMWFSFLQCSLLLALSISIFPSLESLLVLSVLVLTSVLDLCSSAKSVLSYLVASTMCSSTEAAEIQYAAIKAKSAHLTSPASPQADLSRSCSSALPSPNLTANLTASSESVKSKDIFSWSDTELASKFQFLEECGYGNWQVQRCLLLLINVTYPSYF